MAKPIHDDALTPETRVFRVNLFVRLLCRYLLPLLAVGLLLLTALNDSWGIVQWPPHLDETSAGGLAAFALTALPLLAFLFVWATRTRYAIGPNGLALRSWLRGTYRHYPWADYRCFARYYPQRNEFWLYPVNPLATPLVFYILMERSDEFAACVNQYLPEMEQLSEGEIDAESVARFWPALEPEAGLRQLLALRKRVRRLTLAYWLLLPVVLFANSYPIIFWGALCTAPAVALLLIATAPRGAVRWRADDLYRLPGVGWLLTAGAAGLGVKAWNCFTLPITGMLFGNFEHPELLPFSLMVVGFGLPAAVILWLLLPDLRSGSRAGLVLRLVWFLLIFLAGYGYGAGTGYNCLFDRTQPVRQEAVLKKKYISDLGMPKFQLTGWGKPYIGQAVFPEVYRAYQPGQRVPVYIWRGALGVAWYQIGRDRFEGETEYGFEE